MFDKFKFSKGLKNAFKVGVDFFFGAVKRVTTRNDGGPWKWFLRLS